ncbi:UNVERIFIED_CONTAM: hypothetical protein GTU68_017643 [Idotea baltica]|nr:hypothetical protein [Idotea baltica]
MKHFCGLNAIDYEGISICVPQDTTDNNSLTVQEMASSPPVDDIMVEYIRKKQQQLRAQISEEERRGALEKQQLENIIQNTFKSREELLHELSCSPFEISDYEEKKQEKILSQMQIEEKFRSEQSEQLNIYLNSSSDKEALLSDITMQEDSLQLELQAIVAAKESERSRLLQDLSKAEHDADSTLNEILNLQQSQKSADFVHLIEEQDVEMQKLLSNLIDISTELRRNDILKAMQNLLLENAATEAQRDKIEEKQKSWVSSLIKEGQLEEAQIESLIDNRTSNQEIFLNNVLQEEEYQAEAFKLLLLKMDLKRNSVIRQISLVEYELSRLSSLELRKKRCGLQYGSTTMLNKRKTLAGLLQSLLRVKNERDDELNDWVSQMSNNRSLDLTTEDFWLLQYQRLMMIKPTGIAEAEETLDPKVHKILSMACALDLMPVFARENITFSSLMNMLEEDFVALNIGSATYHSIQRALHTYLIGSKLGPQEPSAPFDKDTASAPELDEATPDLSNPIASAPPAVQYIETECVVCLNSDCRVLFLPCGHVCVCASCCQPLSSCPLCRSDILSKCLMNRQ